MKFSTIAKLLLSAAISRNVLAFSPNNHRYDGARSSLSDIASTSSAASFLVHQRSSSPSSSSTSSQLLATNEANSDSTEEESGFFSDLTINPVYAAPWFVFLVVATYFSVTEASGASQVLIESFFADPLHPGFGSSLFETEWNLIGLVGLPLATVIMPGARGQKLNPTPFLVASAFAGYGALGPFMSTRKPVPSVASKDDLGWFTKNVLENKIFNWVLFGLFVNAYLISGAAPALLSDFAGTFVEFKEMISGSALGTATTVDFSILCLTGASLIPEDLKRRGIDDEGKAYAIAASTLLVPAAGLALYSALRPSLPVLDEEA